MSFSSYANTKDTGVEWLGKVPEHWGMKRLKYSLRLLTEKADRRENPIALENIESWSGRYMETEATFEGEGIAFEKGDILFGKLRPYLAKAYLAEAAGEAVGDFHVLRPTDKTTSRFAQYQILNRAFIAIVDSSTFGAKMPRANWNSLGSMVLTVPPISEQISIAEFLDRETAKIDVLIAEQRRLIGLLAEKHRAVIVHSVTKGLNPSVPTKSSGNEWMGKVPSAWVVKRVRHLAMILRGKFTHRPRNDPDFYDGGFPFVQTGDITDSSRYITEFKQTLNERGISVSKEFPKGTLVMAIAANIGDVAILDFPAYFPDSIVGLVPKEDIDLIFLFYLMIAMKQPMLMTATISTQMNLNVDQIASLVAPCPPIEEQRRIVSFLDGETAKLDSLSTEARAAITLLQERRAALISAAVTGKIDVRGQLETQAQAEVAA